VGEADPSFATIACPAHLPVGIRARNSDRFACGLRHPALWLEHFPTMSQSPLKITAYLKTYCGWSEGVRAIMRKYGLEFEEKDIIKNPAFRWEMEQRSGQSLSPCVEINDHMLPDISGEEVEAWMIANGLLQANDEAPDAPINSACTDEQHAAMAQGKLPVPGKIRFID
jgi:monothiol glutaredoxin